MGTGEGLPAEGAVFCGLCTGNGTQDHRNTNTEQEGDGERAEGDVSGTREAAVPSSAGGETEKKNVEINDRGVSSEAVGARVNQNNVTSVVPETKSKEPSSVVGGGEHQNADRENARAELKERKAAGSSDGAAAGENQKSPKAVQLEVESIKDVVAGTSKVKETEADKTEGESPSQCTSNKDENLREETALVQVSDTSVVGEVEMSEPVNENDGFKTPKKKKKKRVQKKGVAAAVGVAKKACKSEGADGAKCWSVAIASTVRESSSESESEDETDLTDSSQTSEFAIIKSGYSEQNIKEFLEVTKGRRKIDVEDFFPDLKMFLNSAAFLVKKASGSNLTEQERWRLKNFVVKTRSSLNQK
ncbi:UNVERIFIED_CONTAM: hypothetical protein FKN15_020844 [Acipenser sinensis]